MSSIRSQRVRRVASGRTNKSRLRSSRSTPRIRSPGSHVPSARSGSSRRRPRTPATGTDRDVERPSGAMSPGHRPRTASSRASAMTRRRGGGQSGDAAPAALGAAFAAANSDRAHTQRPSTAPSASSSSRRVPRPMHGGRSTTASRQGDGAEAKGSAGEGATTADGAGTGARGSQQRRRSSIVRKGAPRRSSDDEIRQLVDRTADHQHDELPEMFHFNTRKKRLLQKHQYETLWKKAQQKLTENLYARYATLVSMFRAFDEDKDGHITFEEFEGRIKKMWDPAHYVGWEARVLFNSVRKPGANSITFPEMQGLFKSSPKTLPGALYSMDGTAVQPEEEDVEHERQELRTTEKRIQEIKTKLVQKVQQKQKMTKAYKKDAMFLMQAFKAFDTNMNGVLSYGEVRNALGPRNLNLGLSDREILDLCLHTDTEDTGSITYGNFIGALSTVDIDKNYDPFKVGRTMDINCLRRATGQDYLEDPADENSRTVKAEAPASGAEDGMMSPTTASQRRAMARRASQVATPSARRSAKASMRRSKSQPGSRRGSRQRLSVAAAASITNDVLNATRKTLALTRDGEVTAPGWTLRRGRRRSSVDAHAFYEPNQEEQLSAYTRLNSQREWAMTPHEMGETFEWRPYSPPPSQPVVMTPTPSLASTMKSTGTALEHPYTAPWAYQTTRDLQQSHRRMQGSGVGRRTATSRPRTSPNPLFSQLRQKVPAHSTRFSANPPRKETGGRVGVGGRGPSTTSAFFLSDKGRFMTTTKSLFSTDEETVDRGSLSREAARRRKAKTAMRSRVLQQQKSRLRRSIRREERKAQSNDRVRVATKSRQRLRYLEHLQRVEEATEIIGAGRGLNGQGTPNARNNSSGWFEHTL